MQPLLAFELLAFLIGLLFGSFLNVCISRLPHHRSIAIPRSHCRHCNATIRWHDNIPLLSFVILRARCRHCREKIPWRYPLVELSIGFWFALVANRIYALSIASGLGIDRSASATFIPEVVIRIGLAILGFLLIGLLVMDWQTHKLPDAFTITGIAIGFFLVCVQAIFLAPGQYDVHLNPKHSLRMSSPGSMSAHGDVFLTGPEHLVYGRLAAIIGAALILIIVNALYKAVRRREGLGLGDAKLLAMIAAFLGFWPAVLSLFIGVILCTLYALTLLARRKAHTLSRLPLGTFLAIGGLIAALFSTQLITWYSSLL